jgi:hypothetical protein
MLAGRNGFFLFNDQACGELTSISSFVEYLRMFHPEQKLPFLRGLSALSRQRVVPTF